MLFTWFIQDKDRDVQRASDLAIAGALRAAGVEKGSGILARLIARWPDVHLLAAAIKVSLTRNYYQSINIITNK